MSDATPRYVPPDRIGQFAIPVENVDRAAAFSADGLGLRFPSHRIARLPDHDLRTAFLRDGEGSLRGLMSEVRPPAAS